MMVIVPCCEPFFVGEKVALTVQFAPAATLDPHVDVTANSVLAFIDAILSDVVPVLVSFTLCGLLVVPTACFLKFSGVVGVNLTTPVLSKVVIAPYKGLRTTMSGLRSPFKSATATEVASNPPEL